MAVVVGAVGAVGVVGAGLMGAGIAQVSAQAGYPVQLYDVSEASLERAMSVVATSLERLVAKGVVTDSPEAVLARITPTTSLESFADVSLAVEAVFERLDVKQDVFRALDDVLSPEAILATNTSALPITQIAAATRRPSRVVGTHFFSPVPLMQLCELVRGEQTSDETLAIAREFAERVGKTCVVVNRDVAGFVTTRLITALAVEAARLVESGVATAEDVDVACRLGFGHPMGPLETMDLVGIDVMVNAADNIAAETPGDTFAAPDSLRAMVAGGTLGRKSGEGFYRY
ncbi:MAG TPA: 3-hydroxyacyl-CoA dehydrogenase family protein [Actinomycetes bacterium]|nr:3-hydroxyacyl-CoA dehydrogenase family protein [Actinomycetes bacterium]